MSQYMDLETNTNMAAPATGQYLPISPESSEDSSLKDAKPKQASRSVSLLTPEQLQRKRAQDRESQRQTRARIKQTISELEKRVAMLTQELHLTRLENASLREDKQLSPPGLISAAVPPQPMPGPEFYPEGTAAIMKATQQKSRMLDFVEMSPQFADSMVIEGHIITGGPANEALVNPKLFYGYEELVPQSLGLHVWEARPMHYPATCLFDKVVLDLIAKLQPIHATGGNAMEFGNTSFPHISALLNPPQQSVMFPLSAEIVQKVIYVFTIDSLPEQIAIMWNMCTLLRWMITGSENDYYAMPDWMRPGAAQIVTAHPIWMDMYNWPKARDRLCRNVEYHDKYNALLNASNETLSINWPYKAEDTLIQLSPSEFTINPVFITHLRNLDNWTLGPQFLEKYPEFEGEINIGKPRVCGKVRIQPEE